MSGLRFPAKGRPLHGDRNQCTGCGCYFNSTRAFDLHRVGSHGVDRRCRTADEMRERGMVLGSDGFWRGSAMPEGLRTTADKPQPVETA